MADLLDAAVRNNARWCDLVGRAHGGTTVTDGQAWTSAVRTPELYPDAVTLVPEPPVADLLARIDTSPGCSIKDSYAALDLSPHGFRVLDRGRMDPPGWRCREGVGRAAPGSLLDAAALGP